MLCFRDSGLWLIGRTLLALLALLPLLPAQETADALAEQVDAEVLTALHARADALHGLKQYARAASIRQAIVEEWSPGDAKALKALGFVQVGDVFKRDMRAVVFTRDLKGDKKALRKADRDWQRTEKDLAKQLEQVAKAYAKAENQERAAVYWRRLLRVRPGYAKALQQLQLLGFDGHEGTAYQLHLLRRGRAIAQACKFLERRDFLATELRDKEHPVLVAAGLEHRGVRSQHFTVWGTLPVADLLDVAKYAERSLALSRLLFGVAGGSVFQPVEVRDIIWVGDRASYHQVLDSCAAQFSPQRLQFLKDDVELAYITHGPASMRLYVLDKAGREVLLDQTVRGVMQDATKFSAHGLWEGIGHAACGFLFDRTLTFFIEQQTGNTVTQFLERPLMPDMKTWRKIASESAWGRSDTPVARLVMLHGSKFSNPERVKAWAMADFLLRDRPHLLFELDASRAEGENAQSNVEASFQQATGLEMPALDQQWRDYWGGQGSLREAMLAEPAGKAKDVEAAREIADALNDARVAADLGPIGFYLPTDDKVKAVHRYFTALSRAEQKQKKDPDKPVAMPVPPAELGRSVLAYRGEDPALAVAHWLLDPVARDALLHPGRILIGCHAGSKALLLELSEPATPTQSGGPITWPRAGQRVVGKATVRDLGQPLVEAFAAIDVQPDAVVGVPLSMHFARKMTADELAAVDCRVWVGGAGREGVRLVVQDVPGLDAPGCVVFVPTEPFSAGDVVEVEWSVPPQLLAEGERFASQTFAVR